MCSCVRFLCFSIAKSHALPIIFTCSYAEVRKCFNNDIAFTDESSISTEFSNKWSSNGCLSEISPSLNSSSGESSVQSSVQRSIASEVIYKSSETTGKKLSQKDKITSDKHLKCILALHVPHTPM